MVLICADVADMCLSCLIFFWEATTESVRQPRHSRRKWSTLSTPSHLIKYDMEIALYKHTTQAETSLQYQSSKIKYSTSPFFTNLQFHISTSHKPQFTFFYFAVKSMGQRLFRKWISLVVWRSCFLGGFTQTGIFGNTVTQHHMLCKLPLLMNAMLHMWKKQDKQ